MSNRQNVAPQKIANITIKKLQYHKCKTANKEYVLTLAYNVYNP